MEDQGNSTSPPSNTNPDSPRKLPVNLAGQQQEVRCNAGNSTNGEKSVVNELARECGVVERWTVILNALTLMALVAAAAIYSGQLNQMSVQSWLLATQIGAASADSAQTSKRIDAQLQQLKLQTIAAQNQVAALKEQMRIDQRPWIGLAGPIVITSIKRDSGRIVFEYTVPIRNFGKSPALRVMASAGVVFDSKDMKRNQEFECSSSRQFADAKIFQYTDREGHNVSIDEANLGKIPPYLREKWGIRNLKPIEKHGTTLFPGDVSTQPVSFSAEVKEATPATAYFPGCIIYRDQFSDSIVHETRFCQEPPASLTSYVIGTPLVHCSISNTAD